MGLSSVERQPLDVPDLLRQHGLRPDHRLGQNFLIDEASLQKVVEAAEIDPGEAVLEIGAGVGNLTRRLAQRAKFVAAVELDERLMPVLRQVLAPFSNVRLVRGDILALDPAGLFEGQEAPPKGYAVVANIPYYITSAVIRHLLEADRRAAGAPRVQRLVLTVQKEVAERICAAPGELSLLALSVQVYGQPRLAGRIPAGAFYPAPKVDSAIVRVDLYPEPRIASERLDLFFQLIKAGFSQKRKTLRNALSGGLKMQPAEAEQLLSSTGIDPRRRAETLSLEEWSGLVEQARDILKDL